MALGMQIHNQNKEAICLHELDAEAAAFWGYEVHEKEYASPRGPYSGCNWFDTIGWRIASSDKDQPNWSDIKSYWIQDKDYRDENGNMLPTIQALVNLCNHWENKGYTPVKLGYVR